MRRPTLKLPDYHKTFVVRTDASNIALRAALMQEADGKLHPATFASKKLNVAEKYSTLKKECLAIVWAVTKFRLFLSAERFILQTDHKLLNSAKFQNDCIMRWSLSLQNYDYGVAYIPGKDNCLADYLSRVI